jgi:uncharacterized OB-fold protein
MPATVSLGNGDSKEFWEGTRQGRLLFQKCCSCGTVQFPPRHHCASCWHEGHEWIESTGKGTVESFTIVRRAPIPAFRDKVPYVVVAILVEEGPRMITTLCGDDAYDVRIGEAVEVEFVEDGAGNVLPKFRRT